MSQDTYAYLGPQGTFCEAALVSYLHGTGQSESVTRVPESNITAVFEAVASGRAKRAVAPIENVVQGPVTTSLDALHTYAGRVKIIDTVILPITQCIGVKGEGVYDIRKVLSHPQALAQCTSFLESNPRFDKAELVTTPSTARAAELVAESSVEDGLAAIASSWALQSHNLVTGDAWEDIGNVKDNKTRFVVLAPTSVDDTDSSGTDGTLIGILPTHDRAGLLLDILKVMSCGGRLNLCAIHSRPDMRGGFRFFIEAECHATSPLLTEALDHLKSELSLSDVSLVIYGTYPLRAFNERKIKTIGIVGGTGKMGGWFTKFFEDIGYTVLVSGRSTVLTHAQLIEQSDAVIINVPISHTEETIRQLAPLCRPGQLLLDNTSIKTQPVQAMSQYAPTGVEVLGMHTVFGPTVGPVRNQNVIFTPTATSGALAQEFQNIFIKYNARVTTTTPEYHDKQMAFHQNLEHFTKIVLARILTEQFTDVFPQDQSSDPNTILSAYASPNSRASLATMGRVHTADPALLQEIQTFNLAGPDMIAAYVQAVNDIGSMVTSREFAEVKDTVVRNESRLSTEYCKHLAAASRVAEAAHSKSQQKQ